MKTSALLAALALLVLISACGGGSSSKATTTGSPAATRPSPSGSVRPASDAEHSFFTALAAVLDQAQSDAQALETEKTQAFASVKSEAERQQAATALATDVATKLEARRDGILNLKPQPPASLRSLHLHLGAAADDELTAARSVSATLADQPVSSETDYEAVRTDVGAADAHARYQQACYAMEDEAVLLEIEADLHCDS